MFEGVKSWLIPILPPEYVSKRVITVLPVRIFDFIFGKVVGLYLAMDNFTGRK
jgi:hypothetical protein